MNNFIGGKLINSNLQVQDRTVVKIIYEEVFGKIRELEFLKVVFETEKTFKLSNGVSVAKNCLFPYHKKDYRDNEEYYFIDKIII